MKGPVNGGLPLETVYRISGEFLILGRKGGV